MRKRKPPNIFVSFFYVCLEDFPEGGFTCRVVPPDEARTMINDARREELLQCVSDEDYYAPYKEREKNKCLELCAALKGTP
jgi:hypothetical protein